MISNGVKEEKIAINGLGVNYKIAGEGPAILILHGWGGSSGSWVEVQKILANNGYKVICPDLPGFGKSVTPSIAWGIKDYSDFVLNFIEKLGIENLSLLGHSFGGRVAIKFAVEHSNKIKSLIFCGSAGIKPKAGLKTKMIVFMAKFGNAVFSPRILKRFKDSARNFFYLFLRSKDYVKAKGIMKETIKKVLEEDLLSELSKIKTKTLIITGEKDKMVPIKYAYMFRDKIQASKIEILPNTGHSSHLECPEKLAEIILDFIK